MIKFTAFRTAKPRQFNYVPRHYDPEKEAREERRKQILGISEVDEGGEYVPGNYIRSQMRSSMYNAKKASKKSFSSRILILLALCGIVAWILLDNIIILFGVLLIGFIAARILMR